MAALAVPLVEAAGAALLRLLAPRGVAAAGAIAANEAAKKAKSGDKAKETPIAEAGTQTQRKDTCSKCPPDCGKLVERNWYMSAESRSYQARITGFAPYTEWSFEGADFDGFKSAACLLLEAKAAYDQFFESAAKPKRFFLITGLLKIREQAERQNAIVVQSPPS